MDIPQLAQRLDGVGEETDRSDGSADPFLHLLVILVVIRTGWEADAPAAAASKAKAQVRS